MRLILASLFFLSVSSVLCLSGDDDIEDSLVDISTNGTSVVGKNGKEEIESVVPDQTVTASTEEESSTTERKQQSWKRGRPDKRHKNRFNQLNQRGKRPNGRKRRPQNEKKGIGKRKNKPVSPIQYLPRSSHTDQLNNVLDEMLEFFSQSLTNGTTTTTIRLNYFNKDIKTLPWTFVTLEKPETKDTNGSKVMETKARRARAANDPEEEVAEVDITDGYNEDDDDEDFNNPEEGQKSSNHEDRLETSAETNTASESHADVKEASSVKEVKTMDDEDEDDDDDGDEIKEPSANVTESKNSTLTLFRTEKPSPVILPDGSLEYNFQLLIEEEVNQTEVASTQEHASSEPNNISEDEIRSARKMESKRERNGPHRRNSRRPVVQVEGLENIQRNGDALIGSRDNSSAHTIDVQLEIGPIHFIMDQRANFLFQQSRVSSPTLAARLRLTESDGQLVAARFKPKKIRPNEVFVTLRLQEDGKLPAHNETTRIVSFLSQEMTRAWNSGYLLRRLKRSFKQAYIKVKTDKNATDLDANKLVEILAHSFLDEQPSTATPIVD